MAEEIKNETAEEISAPVAEETADTGVKGIAKVRKGIIDFLWIPAIIFVVLSALLLYTFGQNLFSVFDYALNEKTIENVAYNIEFIFNGADERMIISFIFFAVIAIIYVVFTVINFARLIIEIVGVFGLLGKKDDETKVKKFGKLSRCILASYGLYFELILLAHMGDFSIKSGGTSVMIISCALYFVIAIIWQLISAEDKNSFDVKKECFKLLKTLLLPVTAILLAIYAITPWGVYLLETVSPAEASGAGIGKEMIIPLTASSVCGFAVAIILGVLVRKIFKNGIVQKENAKKTADRMLFGGALTYMIFALIKAVAMSLGGVMTGTGFSSATLILELKALLIPFIVFLAIISLTKFSSEKE